MGGSPTNHRLGRNSTNQLNALMQGCPLGTKTASSAIQRLRSNTNLHNGGMPPQDSQQIDVKRAQAHIKAIVETQKMTRQKNLEFPLGLSTFSQKSPSFNYGVVTNPPGSNLDYPLKTKIVQDEYLYHETGGGSPTVAASYP